MHRPKQRGCDRVAVSGPNDENAATRTPLPDLTKPRGGRFAGSPQTVVARTILGGRVCSVSPSPVCFWGAFFRHRAHVQAARRCGQRAPADARRGEVEMDLLVQARFNAVRVTQVWAPGETTPSVADQGILRSVVQAARLDGCR
jgi:hypothetical protein